MIEAVSAPIEEQALRIEATVSIGIASSQDDIGDAAIDSEALIHHADIAMYHAKKRGRNRSYWFEPQMESELRFRAELEAGIRRGIPAGEFVPYYEQQVDLTTGDLVGFEMLARWQSAQFGLVGPDVFIPIAEEIDLIAELSRNARSAKALCDAGSSARPCRSTSPRCSCAIRGLPRSCCSLLTDSGFPPERLDVEITESSLHENIGAVRTIVASLKNQGIRISLDDFGTGYSGLSQLRSLPFGPAQDRPQLRRRSSRRRSEQRDRRSDHLAGPRPVAAGDCRRGRDRAILEALRTHGPASRPGLLLRPARGCAPRANVLAKMKLLPKGAADAETVRAPKGRLTSHCPNGRPCPG